MKMRRRMAVYDLEKYGVSESPDCSGRREVLNRDDRPDFCIPSFRKCISLLVFSPHTSTSGIIPPFLGGHSNILRLRRFVFNLHFIVLHTPRFRKSPWLALPCQFSFADLPSLQSPCHTADIQCQTRLRHGHFLQIHLQAQPNCFCGS